MLGNSFLIVTCFKTFGKALSYWARFLVYKEQTPFAICVFPSDVWYKEKVDEQSTRWSVRFLPVLIFFRSCVTIHSLCCTACWDIPLSENGSAVEKPPRTWALSGKKMCLQINKSMEMQQTPGCSRSMGTLQEGKLDSENWAQHRISGQQWFSVSGGFPDL